MGNVKTFPILCYPVTIWFWLCVHKSLDMRAGVGGGRSSGSDNENPVINMTSSIAAPQEYVPPHKMLSSSENLNMGQGPELKYGGDKLPPYMYQGKLIVISSYMHVIITISCLILDNTLDGPEKDENACHLEIRIKHYDLLSSVLCCSGFTSFRTYE